MPFGYLEFSRAKGGRARAAAGGGRPAPAPVPVPGPGPGLGLGLGLGSLPGLVLFEPGVAGMGYSATRTKPDPLQPANGCPRERIQTAVGKPTVRLGG